MGSGTEVREDRPTGVVVDQGVSEVEDVLGRGPKVRKGRVGPLVSLSVTVVDPPGSGRIFGTSPKRDALLLFSVKDGTRIFYVRKWWPITVHRGPREVGDGRGRTRPRDRDPRGLEGLQGRIDGVRRGR